MKIDEYSYILESEYKPKTFDIKNIFKIFL